MPDVTSHVVPASAAGTRLVDHLKERLVVVATREVGPLIAGGAVTLERGSARRTAAIADTLAVGDRLEVDVGALDELAARGRVTPPGEVPVVAVYEDADLVVVDKPAGVHVHPMGPYRDDTLVGAMLWRAGARPDSPWGDWRPYPAHRLDRPTSGLLAFAKRREVQDAFRQLLEAGAVQRRYRAVVEGQIDGAAGTVDLPLGPDPDSPYRRTHVPEDEGGQLAVSHWEVVARDGATTTVEVTLETGRTHQIRAHLASLGHPIVGDTLYGAHDDGELVDPTVGARIGLRATHLAFPHPVTGAAIAVAAPEGRSGKNAAAP